MAKDQENEDWAPPDPGMADSAASRSGVSVPPTDPESAGSAGADGRAEPAGPTVPDGSAAPLGPAPILPPAQSAMPPDAPGWAQQPPPWPGTYGAAPGHPERGRDGWAGPPPPGRPPGGEPWVVETPPGVPYQQMARNRVQRWWRPVVGSFAIVLTGLLALVPIVFVWILVQVGLLGREAEELFNPQAGPLFGGVNAELGFTLVSVAVFLPLVPLAAWIFQRRRPGTVSSVVGRLRWRWLLLCLGLAVLTSIASILITWATSLLVDDPAVMDGEGGWVGWGAFWVPLVLVVLLVPFQASAEEYFFRGWLLQAIGSCTLERRTGRVGRGLSRVFRTPWPAICISGVAFMSLHGYVGWAAGAIFMFAVITGWLTVRTGGLEAAIAVHVVNNTVAFLVPAAFGQLSLEQGAIPLPYVIADVLPMALYGAIAAALARRLRLQTRTPVAERVGGGERPERADRTDRGEIDQDGRIDRGDRADRGDHIGREDRNERADDERDGRADPPR
ncbi:CPBP family intramembrane glutamic endopeptidase [Thermomonospora catenispora]|uniref:CPBP family intramembrane glutamic endopeptidase n=1 Tax=Thermomonospora catenispora TaxID=2493090 RepID=UPI001122AF70|nr:CPBP family intramembrane glutamic endopeptidase [Thermomonospora catenispora]TNY35181.1 CPBP family intramembrane metalloprotease [Thermomonospora catenispora]